MDPNFMAHLARQWADEYHHVAEFEAVVESSTPSRTGASLVMALRCRLGAALVVAGEHLQGVTRGGVSEHTGPTAAG